jgi:zinc protease
VPARDGGPGADLERLFNFYAARLKNFSIAEADAARERNVVRQEHDWRIGSRPLVRFIRELDHALMPNHPSGQWVVGTPQEIDAFTVDEARDFHRTWYVLNNVYFVVKADIDAVALKHIANKALGDLEEHPLPPRSFGREPEIGIERKDLRATEASLQRPVVYYKKLVHFDNTELSQAAARTVVTGFLRSRLPGSVHDAVMDKAALASVPPSVSFVRVSQKSFVLTIGAPVAPDVAPEALVSAIVNYVDGLAANGMSNATLARLKSRQADIYATIAQDPKRSYDRLVAWLANRNRFEDLLLQPRRVAVVSHEQVMAMLKVLSGPGRIVTGIVAPPDPPK